MQQVPLLLYRRELGVALIDDEVQQRIANALVGDVHDGRPFPLTLVMTELDVRHFLIAELCVELERAQRALRQTDRILPVFEVINPVVEVAKFADHFSDSSSVDVLPEWQRALPDRRFRCRASLRACCVPTGRALPWF